MPDGTYHEVQTPDGKTIQFPVSMSNQDINVAMQKMYPTTRGPGRGGSPTSAQIAATQQPEGMGTKIARGGALGAFSGMGIAETQHPIADTLKSLVPSSWKDALLQDNPLTAGPYAAYRGYQGMVKKPVSDLSEGIKEKDPEQIAHGSSQLLTEALMAFIGKGEAEDAGSTATSGLRKFAQETTNTGQSAANLRSYLHDSATTKVKPLIQGIASTVHDNASQAMSSVAQQVDALHPEGAFEKAPIRAQVKEAMGDIVKIPEKAPTSVSKILNDPDMTGKTGFGKSTGPAVGGRHFDLNNTSDLKAYQRMKSSGAFTPEEIARMEGSAPAGNWSFEQLKQLRSEVGMERSGLSGPTRAATDRVYSILSDHLRSMAKESAQADERPNGLEPQWLEANSMWKSYLDDFIRGPLKGTMKGQNAADITEPFIGKNSELVNRTLKKYGDILPPQLMDQLMQEINKHKIGQNAQKWSQPSKWDLVVAGISPKAAAVRLGIPRAMRSPKVIEAITGKGLPDIPVNKISPKAP